MAIRAFILEDDFLSALGLREALVSRGCDIVGIADSLAAALPFLEQDIHLAFIDFNLADGFTGPQIAHRLIERGVLTICLTANPGLLSKVDGWPAPIYGKPLEAAVMLSLIDECLAKLNIADLARTPKTDRDDDCDKIAARSIIKRCQPNL